MSTFAVRKKQKTIIYTIKNSKNSNMTKAEIVNSIVEKTGIGKREVSTTIEALMEEIRYSLANNKENVYLRGFGSFIVKHRAQKTARNISKNTTLVIEAHDLPAFKPCKSFIDRMLKTDASANAE